MNQEIHGQGQTGKMCALRLEDTLIPLCWWLWRHEDKGKILRDEFKIVTKSANSQDSDTEFFKWMLTIGGNGLPYMLKVLRMAIDKNWVALKKD